MAIPLLPCSSALRIAAPFKMRCPPYNPLARTTIENPVSNSISIVAVEPGFECYQETGLCYIILQIFDL
jgi:hypothetical protein